MSIFYLTVRVIGDLVILTSLIMFMFIFISFSIGRCYRCFLFILLCIDSTCLYCFIFMAFFLLFILIIMINTDNHHYAILIISLPILFIIASACICVNIIIKVLQLQNT